MVRGSHVVSYPELWKRSATRVELCADGCQDGHVACREKSTIRTEHEGGPREVWAEYIDPESMPNHPHTRFLSSVASRCSRSRSTLAVNLHGRQVVWLCVPCFSLVVATGTTGFLLCSETLAVHKSHTRFVVRSAPALSPARSALGARRSLARSDRAPLVLPMKTMAVC
jgi:hypothetical protein